MDFIEHIVPGEVALRCVEYGRETAPVLVLLHGLRAYAHWFDEFSEVAAQKFRVIALDQRGRGGSGKAPDGVYNTDAYVADVARVVKHFGLEKFTLIGHSMGGTNAINYAAAHPEQMAALVIVDSAPELDMAGLTRMRSEMARTPPAFVSRADATAFLTKLHHKATARSLATRLNWMLRENAAGGMEWRIDPAIFDPRMTPDAPARGWDALAKITCPALMVRGAMSDVITAATAQRVVATLAACAYVEIAAAGHMVVEENPHDFTTEVMDFLEKVLGK
jgi:pimeloyl-ACP methyl ester carboxylesterase